MIAISQKLNYNERLGDFMSLISGIDTILRNEEAMSIAEEEFQELESDEAISDAIIDAMVDGYNPDEDDPEEGLDPDLGEDEDNLNFDEDGTLDPGFDINDDEDDDDIDIDEEISLIEDSIVDDSMKTPGLDDTDENDDDINDDDDF